MALYPKVKAKSLKLPSSRICVAKIVMQHSRLRRIANPQGNRSSLFKRQIANPPERLAGLSSTSAKKSVRYNMAGQQVNASYKGLVIENGKKFVQK